MLKLLISLLAALVLPSPLNAKKNYKTLFRGEYDGYKDIVVEKIYDEWRDTTSCKIYMQGWWAKIDPSNYQLHINGNLTNTDGGYKFDNGRINKFNPKNKLKYKISIPYSKWSKHKILLVNEGSGYMNIGGPTGSDLADWRKHTSFTKIDLKVINKARKHHEACLKGGPSWLY